MLVASTRPFHVLKGYWNASKVDAARVQLLALMHDCHERGEGGDRRTLGASRLARLAPEKYSLVLEFERDPMLRRIAEHHLGTSRASVDTLAAVATPGSASGGGWHKDQHARGFKALMYLDDVVSTNGPFSMLINYNDSAVLPLPGRLGRRYTDDAIARAVKGGATVHSFYASQGTVIVFETSNIHRGAPCSKGSRHSFTNYYENTPNVCRNTHATSNQSNQPRRGSRWPLSDTWARAYALGARAWVPLREGSVAGLAIRGS